MSLGTIVACLLGDALAGKPKMPGRRVIRAGKKVI